MIRRDLFVLLALVAFLISVALFWDYSIDDAYITFKYAENLANGHGLVFQTGAAPVEGYSNFLWLLLLTLLYKSGLVTALAAKIVGVLSFAVAGLAWYGWFRRDSHSLVWLTGPLFLVCPLTGFWAASGLELGLHALLLSLFMMALLKKSGLTWAVLPLLLLSRPEAIALAIVVILLAALIDIKSGKPDYRFYTIALIVVFVTIVSLTVFRLGYFGYPFPNTFYAKTHYRNNGLAELSRMLLWLFPLSLALIWSLIRTIRRFTSDRLMIICVAVVIVQAIISSGVDPVMNFWFRYMIPILPMFILLTLTAVEQLPVGAARASASAVVIISLMAMVPWLQRFESDNARIIQAQKKVVEWARGLPESTTISMSDMGRIPYETSVKYNDLWGLVDLDIAHKGFNAAWEFLELPDYFVLVGYIDSTGFELKFWRERDIAYTEHFARCYALVRTFSPNGKTATDPSYTYLAFLRQPNARQIVESYGSAYWQNLLFGE